MFKNFKKDIPLYLNGFFTGYLVFGREWGLLELALLLLCGITFVWAINDNKK
jgi:hypothetical protein